MVKKKKPKRAKKYEQKLAINGSFNDVMNVIVRDIKSPVKPKSRAK